MFKLFQVNWAYCSKKDVVPDYTHTVRNAQNPFLKQNINKNKTKPVNIFFIFSHLKYVCG